MIPIQSLRTVALCCRFLFAVLLSASLAAAPAAAQSCNIESGAETGTGQKCSKPGIDTTHSDLPVDQDKSSYAMWHIGSVTDKEVVDLIAPQLGTLNEAGVGAEMVLGGGGNVMLASGAQVRRWPLLSRDAGAPGSGLDLDLTLNSVLQSQVGLGAAQKYLDPTPGEDPFGPGTRWSLSEGILKQDYEASSPPSTITWVDRVGTAWSFDEAERYEPQEQQQQSKSSSTQSFQSGDSWVIYEGHAGSRLLAFKASAANVWTWYREFPDHTLIQYEARADIAARAAGEVATRIDRIFRGPWGGTPYWQQDFIYTQGSDLLSEVKDDRGSSGNGLSWVFEWAPAWPAGNGYAAGPARVVAVGLVHGSYSHPDFPTWTQSGNLLHKVRFEYHEYGTAQQGYLSKIVYPSAAFEYSPAGDLDNRGTYNRLAIGFLWTDVDSGPGTVLQATQIFRHLTGTGTSSDLAELYALTVFDSTVHWRVLQHTEGVSSPNGSRVHQFTWSDAAKYLEYTDPLSNLHRFYSNVGGSSLTPTTWHVVSYVRNPGTAEARTWGFDWDSCGCGRLTGMTLPSGRKETRQYDTQGRGFLTNLKIFDSATVERRSWSIVYKNWGYPWDTGLSYHTASRITSFTPETGATWGVIHGSSSYGGVQSAVNISDGGNPQAFSYVIHDDALSRVCKIQAPGFNSYQNPVVVSTTYDYYDASDPGYRMLESVTSLRVIGSGSSPSLAVDTFEYDALGRLTGYTDALNQARTFTHDLHGRVIGVTLPSISSDKGGTVTRGASATYGLFDEVVELRVLANDVDGNAYGAGAEIASQTGLDFLGQVIESRVENQKLEIAGSGWLETRRVYDGAGRLKEIQLPGGRKLQYELDSFDMVTAVRRRHLVSAQGNPSTWPTRTFSYNSDGLTTETTDATGYKETSEYDTLGRVWRIVQASDHPDSSRRKTTEVKYPDTDGDGSNDNLPLLLPTKILTKIGSTQVSERAYEYDILGRITKSSVSDTSGSHNGATHYTNYFYNGLSRLAYVTDKNGRLVKYQYDSSGALREVQDGLSGTPNKSIRYRDALGRVTVSLAELQSESTSGGFSTSSWREELTYNAADQVTKVLRVGKVGAGGTPGERNFGYDSLGNRTWTRRLLNPGVYQVTEVAFDTLGRMREQTLYPKTGGSGGTVVTKQDFDDAPGSYGSDGFGTALGSDNLSLVVTRTTAKSGTPVTTQYLVDKLGRLIDKRLPGFQSSGHKHGWSYEYDDEGRLSKWKDGNGHEVRVIRQINAGVSDPFRRPTLRYVVPNLAAAVPLSVGTTHERWIYDDANQVVNYETRRGAFLSGSVSHASDSAITSTGSLLVREVRSFDALGRMHSEAYDFDDTGSGPVLSATLQHGYAHGTSGDDTGFRRSLTLGSSWTFEFDPDPAGKLKEIKAGLGTASSTFATYRYEGGRVASRDWRNDGSAAFYRNTYTVNHLGYLEGLNTELLGANYRFDSAQKRDLEGGVLWRSYSSHDNSPGTPSWAGGQWFKTDAYDRLADVKYDPPASSFTSGATYSSFDSVTGYSKRVTYAMDKGQNRTSEQVEGAGPLTYLTEDGTNRLSQVGGLAFVYDDNGNLAFDGFQIFYYDYLDRLCEIWRPVAMSSSSSSSTPQTSGPQSWPAMSLTKEQFAKLLGDIESSGIRTDAQRDGIEKLFGDAKRVVSKSPSMQSSSQSSLTWMPVGLYGYDTFNRRILRQALYDNPDNPGNNVVITRHYTYDGWQCREEYAKDGQGQYKIFKVHFDGQGIDEHLGFAIATHVGEDVNWTKFTLIQDPQGNVMELVDQGGNRIERYRYDVYGNREVWTWGGSSWVSKTGASPLYDQQYGYTGRRHDPEALLIYYRLRYFYPFFGRFLTQDPIGNWGDAGNWGNGYAYVGNQGSIAVDPLGLSKRPGPWSKAAAHPGFRNGPLSGGAGADGPHIEDGGAVWSARQDAGGAGEGEGEGKKAQRGDSCDGREVTNDLIQRVPIWRNSAIQCHGIGGPYFQYSPDHLASSIYRPTFGEMVEALEVAVTIVEAVPGVGTVVSVVHATVQVVNGDYAGALQTAIGIIPVPGLGLVVKAGVTAGVVAATVKVVRNARIVGRCSRAVIGRTRSLQKFFNKHGRDFGLTGNWNPQRATDASRRVNQFINGPNILVKPGEYRGDAVIHYLDRGTGLNVVATPDGQFISGWKLSNEQLESVVTTGRLF